MSDSPKLKVINGHAYANSLEIARRFNKSHDNVLKAIRKKIRDCSESFGLVNFNATSAPDRWNREQPIFNLTRDGFAIVAMSFTGPEATIWQEAFLDAFNEMEAELQRRNVKQGTFEQMNIFPDLQQTIDANRPTLTVAAVLTIIAYEGLMIPVVTRKQIVGMIQRGRLEGFHDGRKWQVYQDSFDTFLNLRRRYVAKAA